MTFHYRLSPDPFYILIGAVTLAVFLLGALALLWP